MRKIFAEVSMKDIKSYELDLDLLLDQWNMGIIGEELDSISTHNLQSLKRRLIKLAKEYMAIDEDLEHLLTNDSAGG